MANDSASRPAPRFRTIDGLRGIAALSVAVFHFHGAVERAAPHWVPEWIAAPARLGGMGVDIFFVISGFVIAFSVRDGAYSVRYLWLFALRRSIRLDPPYWCVIALEIALTAVSLQFFPFVKSTVPDVPTVLAHLVYAQEILGYGSILEIFWTLCFEIQFYLLFVSLLVVWQKLRLRVPSELLTTLAWIVLTGLFVLSLSLRFSSLHAPIPGLALLRWFQFFLGVLTWWVVAGSVSPRLLGAAWGATLGGIVVWDAAWVQILPILVSAFIFLVGRAGRLDTLLSNGPLQFFGQISYSLYLFHGPVGERWISLLQHLVGESFGIGWACFAFVSALGISVVTSTIAWKLIEVPTMRLSKRIRLKTTSNAVTQRPAAELPSSLATI